MTTLVVDGIHDYRGETLHGITDIDFVNGGSGEFAASQFDGTQISQTVTAVGDDTYNNFEIDLGTLHNFSAAGITLANWQDFDTFEIFGTTDVDTITGSAFADILIGDGGGDILNGGDGNDTFIYYGGTFADVVDGGAGSNTLDLVGGADNLVLSSLTNISNLQFRFDASITLSGDQIGKAGTILTVIGDGGGPSDAANSLTVNGSDVDLLAVTFGAWDTAVDSIHINGTSSSSNFLDGSREPDIINGAAGADLVFGEDGDDQLFGNGGNDVLHGGFGNDLIDGGAGEDTANYQEIGPASGDVGITINLATTGPQNTGFAGIDTLVNIEDVVGTFFSDSLTGNDSANVLQGNGGSDTLDGGLGTDTLEGGPGNDTYILRDVHQVQIVISGAAGSVGAAGPGPIFNFYAYDTVTENQSDGTDLVEVFPVTNGTGYTLPANVENGVIEGTGSFFLQGNALANDLAGNAFANVLNGDAGPDHMSGNGGDDTYVVDNTGDVVTENASEGTDTVETTLTSYTLPANVENLIFTDGAAHTGNGNALDNVLTSGTGADHLAGGAGNDTYVIDGAADVVTENANQGTDTVQTTLASYALGANVENLTFTDGAAHTGNGNGLANTITGGSGNDTLFGSTGRDILEGGDGNDTLSGNAAGTGAFLSEGNILDGGNGDDTLLGAVTDTISGGAGHDSLQAVNANPWSIDLGATSIETMLAGFGNDQITAATQTVGVTVFASGGNDILTGSSFNDFLWAGVGNDTLSGGSGNDLLFGDLGADSLSGGAGNDSLYADSADTHIDGGAGTDALYWAAGANANIDLAADAVEFVQTLGDNDTLNGASASVSLTIFAGAGNDTATGGSAADFLWGEAGNDTLIGNGGNDTLVGGLGADRLTGGAGNDNLYGNSGSAGDGAADTFIFTANFGTDFVYDFDDGIDKLDMTALHTSFANLTVSSSNGNADVDFGANHIIVVGQAGYISAGDFLF